MRLLSAAIRERLDQCPEGSRPKVVMFGESLGAWTSQDGFVDEGTRGLVEALQTVGRALPVCLVVSYQPDELHRRHPVRELRRHRLQPRQ